jgi:hypothetical protein
VLTPEQEAFFRTFGYIVMPRYFRPDEMATISEEFEDTLLQDRQGKQFPGDRRQLVFGFIEKRPRLTPLVEDDRLYAVIAQLLGADFMWNCSECSLYVGDTGWHPDGSLDYSRIKVAFYLDPVTIDTGCLRVLPGSHRWPLHEALGPLSQQRKDPTFTPFGVDQPGIPAFPLESQPGDVVFFDCNLWHASFGGRTGRRMFTLNYYAYPRNEEQLAYNQSIYQMNLNQIRNGSFTQTDHLYEESFLYSDRPRIKGMVRKLVELGFK